MQKPIASLMAVGLLLLAACSTAEVEPGPITSFDDIAGTIYQIQGSGGQFFFYFFEDGTWHGSSNRDLVEERPIGIAETRFEGTTVFLKQIKGICFNTWGAGDDLDATYEIHLLENGNLQLVAIEDPCAFRSSLFLAEFTPLP